MTQGSCAAWAIGYYTKTYHEAKEHNWNLSETNWEINQPSPSYQDKIMSPPFLYKLLNGGEYKGIWFKDPINLICDVDIVSWKEMPYVEENYTYWPSEAAWMEAAYYRGDSAGYQFLYVDSDEGIASLKSLSASGNLAITTVNAHKFFEFTDNDVLERD